jgi:hypothetical protein
MVVLKWARFHSRSSSLESRLRWGENLRVPRKENSPGFSPGSDIESLSTNVFFGNNAPPSRPPSQGSPSGMPCPNCTRAASWGGFQGDSLGDVFPGPKPMGCSVFALRAMQEVQTALGVRIIVPVNVAASGRILHYACTSVNATENPMKTFVISILAASILALKSTAEDVPGSSPTPGESPAAEMDEPALPAAEQNTPASSPDLLPESSQLPEHLPAAEGSTNQKLLATRATEDTERQKRFKQIRSQAENDPHTAYLLKRAKRSSRSATRRNYLRAYYVSLAERMCKLDPRLKSSIETYERAKLRDIGARDVPQHASRVGSRKTSHKTHYETHYASHRSHSHHHRYHLVEDPYGPEYLPYPYYGPPVVFYPW